MEYTPLERGDQTEIVLRDYDKHSGRYNSDAAWLNTHHEARIAELERNQP